MNRFIEAGRVPRHLFPWKAGLMNAKVIGNNGFLFHVCDAGLHMVDDDGYGGYTVMDDSDRELSRHLHAVKHAKGRVLKTGLGMGCFVRMCLQKDDVEHVDVVEINPDIIRHFGEEFEGNPRVTIHERDALNFSPEHGPWDFAWHDIYCEGNAGLQPLHCELLVRYMAVTSLQGAWQLPRWIRKKGKRII